MDKPLYTPAKISFIIPTLNNNKLLEQCIKSINDVCMAGASASIPYEIIVVKDGSPSGINQSLKEMSAELSFRLIENSTYLGYTGTINLGIRNSSGDLLILLNDDIRFEQKEWLSLILDTLQKSPRVGIIGCRLLYPNRRIQHGGMYYCGGLQLLGHRSWGRRENTPDALKICKTAAVTGAILVVRRPVVDDIGLLNEDFTMLCSDTDYCLSAHQKGWMIIYNGKAYAIHHESQTRRSLGSRLLGAVEQRDLIKFYRKWSRVLSYMHARKMI